MNELTFPKFYNVDELLRMLVEGQDVLEFTGYASEAALAKALSKYCPNRPAKAGVLAYLRSLSPKTTKPGLGTPMTRIVKGKEYVYALLDGDNISYVRPVESDPDYEDRIMHYKKDLGLSVFDELPA